MLGRAWGYTGPYEGELGVTADGRLEVHEW